MPADPISRHDMDKLVRFLGYGPAKPELLFLGTEEAGGGPEIISARVEKFEDREDLCEACKKLETVSGLKNPFESRGNPITQWNTASIFALALASHDTSCWPEFWRNSLGRWSKTTFLMECNPVPRKGLALKIAGYDPKTVWRTRKDILKGFLSKARPQFVVAYGNTARDACCELFEIDTWQSVEGTKWTVGKSSNGTVVARVGFFGYGHFNRKDVGIIASEMIKLRAATD